MNDKTSQRTHEEMLDQTFDGYQDDINMTTEEAPAPTESTKPKKNNQNAIIFGAGGLAAVGVLAYMFLVPNNEPIQTQMPPQAVAPVAPVAPVVPVTPTPEPVVAVAPTQPQPAVNPFNTQDLNNQGIQPNAPVINNQPQNNFGDLNGNGSMNSGIDIGNAPAINPVQIQPVQPQVNVAPVENVATPIVANNNNAQQELVEQLRAMFEQQTREIKESVDKVGDRVTEVEKSITEQKEINKTIEERLAKLEAGQQTTVKKSSNATTTVRAKPVVRRAPVKKAEPRESYDSNANLLVDKSAERQVSQRATANTVPTYQDIQIHSVFAGRVWTKNNDGTLSTYAAGDTLSTGEVIRRVDDEKAQIITNKRVIK